MDIQIKEKGILFSDIHENLEVLLRQLPGCEEIHGERARERFFPEAYPNWEDDAERDWEELVHSELEQKFQESQDVVARDIAAMRKNAKGKLELFIPFEHVDAWLNCLNQARLAIAAEYDLDEDDLNSMDPGWGDLHRRSAILRVHVYGHIQETLLMGIGEA